MSSTISSGGDKYTAVIYRGTEYTLHRGSFGWELHSRRLSYGGRFHCGTFKGYFATLADVQAKCRAFAGAELSAVL
jgi:hypothetical protein